MSTPRRCRRGSDGALASGLCAWRSDGAPRPRSAHRCVRGPCGPGVDVGVDAFALCNEAVAGVRGDGVMGVWRHDDVRGDCGGLGSPPRRTTTQSRWQLPPTNPPPPIKCCPGAPFIAPAVCSRTTYGDATADSRCPVPRQRATASRLKPLLPLSAAIRPLGLFRATAGCISGPDSASLPFCRRPHLVSG
jgi:hypothetical protein